MGEQNQPDGNEPPAGGEVEQMKTQLAKLNEAMKTRDTEYNTLKETYERTNALLQTMIDSQGKPPAGGAPEGGRGAEIELGIDFNGKYGMPNEAVQEIVAHTLKVAEQRLDKKVVALTQMAQSRESFYKKNPDLVGHEFLVGSISQQVQAENPALTLDKAFELVAKKTREYIKSLQDSHSGGDGGVPPIAGNGGSKDGGAGGGNEPPPEPEFTPEQELQNEIASRQKSRNRGFSKSRLS